MNERLRGEIHRPRSSVLDERWLWGLVRLERRCYAPGLAYSPEMIAEHLLDPASLIVGLWRGDRLAAAQISDLDAGHLVTLDVHPDDQRRGIGRRLLRITLHLQRRWGGHERVLCEIGTENRASLALHRQEGFVAIGFLPGYYRDGQDAIAMARRLAPAQ